MFVDREAVLSLELRLVGGKEVGDRVREVDRGQMNKALWTKINSGFILRAVGNNWEF